MRKDYIHFVREIYSYCDENIGEKVLFPAFMNLWDENGEASYISRKDLAVLTSKIISRLLNKDKKKKREKILRVIHSNYKLHDAYGFYKIRSHKNLMHYTDLTEKKMKLLKL